MGVGVGGGGGVGSEKTTLKKAQPYRKKLFNVEGSESIDLKFTEIFYTVYLSTYLVVWIAKINKAQR